ncbi:MAG: cation transporter [Coriobacteriia bacterium]|nr:cation transporter [Coriobacteriia bacterium]
MRFGGRRVRTVRRVLLAILGLNASVAAAKIAYGLLSGSIAMRADGFHSLFDGLSNVIGLVGIGLASRPADRTHPYGHGKFETYASAAIGAMLMLAAYNVGSEALGRLLDGPDGAPRVDAGSFAVMLGTLAVNIGVTLYERGIGRRIGSQILVADASHTGSDVLVSLGVIAGLVAVRLGFPAADPIIALLVAVAIVLTAVRVLGEAGLTLSDRARIDPQLLCSVVLRIPGVLGCHSIRTRGSESEVYADLHIQVEPSVTVEQGHLVAEEVERGVTEAFPEVVDAIVHLEPLDAYQVSKTESEAEQGLAPAPAAGPADRPERRR